MPGKEVDQWSIAHAVLFPKYTKYTIDHPHFQVNTLVVDPGDGWGAQHPLLFLTKMRPKGPKKVFLETDPPDPPNTPSINLISKSIYIKSIVHLPNLVSGQVGYEELAGGFKPIRNGEIF